MKRILSLLLAAPLAACITSLAQTFTPTPGQPRLSEDQARDHLDAVVRAECPRLLRADRPTDAAELTLDIDSKGDVARAQISRSSGDTQMDRAFGGVAARMHFRPPTAADLKGEQTVAGHVRMGYSCSAKAAVVTIELR